MKNAHDTTASRITPAATVILIREQVGTFQVYLLQRNFSSAFMAGNYVFPGGTLDGDDHQYHLLEKHCDLAPDEISTRYGPALSNEQALAYCAAAIRETLEEAGVFLACKTSSSAPDLDRINRLRLTEGLQAGWLLSLVENEKWRLSLSTLHSWSHWITPVLMKRRFDTRFFIAEMPAGQSCQPDDRETVQGHWLNPAEALAGNLAGDIPLSPPTLVSLHEMVNFPDWKSLRKESERRQWGASIQPRLVSLPDSAVIVEPWDPMYHQKEIDINPAALPSSVLPVEAPFSRIWLDNNIWKPVSIS